MKVIITLEGDFPKKYMKYKKDIIERIENDAEDVFGDYEIWGEFFPGDDENIYTLFLPTTTCR